MKSFTDLLHKTPWWALLFGGVLVFLGLAAFVTPYHIIDYRNEGDTPEERRAIKREIDNAFAENAIDVARSVIIGIRKATKDEEERQELDSALEGLEEARKELREAGGEAQRSKREALEATREAARTAAKAIRDAKRQAEEAMGKDSAGAKQLDKALEEALKAAQEAEGDAQKSLAESRSKRIRIGAGAGDGKPMIDIDIDTAAPAKDAGKPGVGVKIGPATPPVPPVALAPPVPPAPAIPDPLPPEVRDQIRSNVIGDMYRIGIGAALILILLPLFILAVVSKFLIDRSRASLRLAELKRKEAEYHRMGQQVTEAKLQALQAQVEPHFLYNTLASVQALTEVDPQQANAMTGHLIQYLRNALPKMREGVSTVGQEIELVRAYLNILQMRMGKRLAFEIAVPVDLLNMAFPPLMLPSLVENAIKHGLEPQREGGAVHISARIEGSVLSVAVADTGRGFGETIGTGVGLANIRERLAALYGDKGKLTLEANTPNGVVATLEIPTNGNVSRPDAPAFAGATAEVAPAMAAEPKGFAAKTLSAMGTAERVWRKALSFTFVALVLVAAVAAGLGIVGTLSGLMPVQIGDEVIPGAGGAIVGTAGIALAFLVVVLVLAVVIAVVYGLGFLMVGIAIFIPVVVLISLAPVLAPFVLLGVLLWWVFRNKKKDDEKKAAEAAARVQ